MAFMQKKKIENKDENRAAGGEDHEHDHDHDHSGSKDVISVHYHEDGKMHMVFPEEAAGSLERDYLRELFEKVSARTDEQ
jgi:ABC-type Zn2+ transport system substrate-binding protein/surface adhesin